MLAYVRPVVSLVRSIHEVGSIWSEPIARSHRHSQIQVLLLINSKLPSCNPFPPFPPSFPHWNFHQNPEVTALLKSLTPCSLHTSQSCCVGSTRFFYSHILLACTTSLCLYTCTHIHRYTQTYTDSFTSKEPRRNCWMPSDCGERDWSLKILTCWVA